MVSSGEAEVIQEDVEMYTILGLVVFTSYFISWGIDVYKSCQTRSRKKKRNANTRSAAWGEEKEVEMSKFDENKDDDIHTTSNPMHAKIYIPKGKSNKKKRKGCSEYFNFGKINTSLLKTIAGNLLIGLYIFFNFYILGNSWWYTIGRTKASQYFS
jgi:hypothetical protein